MGQRPEDRDRFFQRFHIDERVRSNRANSLLHQIHEHRDDSIWSGLQNKAILADFRLQVCRFTVIAALNHSARSNRMRPRLGMVHPGKPKSLTTP